MNTQKLTYLANSTRVEGSGEAITLLRGQDVQLELARHRAVQSNEEQVVRSAIEEGQVSAFGAMCATHFQSYCRECTAVLAYYIKPPWNKWYCDHCGHGFNTSVFTCSSSPLKCSNTYCSKCFLLKCKLAPPPTNAYVPPPSLPPEKTRSPKSVKKKQVKQPLKVTFTTTTQLRDVEADEQMYRHILVELWADSREEVIHLHNMLLTRPVQVNDDKKVIKEASVRVAKERVKRGTKGWNVEKADEQTDNYESARKEEMVLFAQQIELWYNEKPGDVLTELEENLRFPCSMDTLSILSVISNALLEKDDVVATYGGILSELLVLRQYTQKPIDVDRDVMWDDVPSLDDPSHERDNYESQYSDWNWEDSRKRNGSIFGPVCSALRDQGPNGSRSPWSKDIIKKWIKWICTVAAVCAQHGEEQQVYRGLGGGHLPAQVVEAHRDLKQGHVMGWPALSSTSFDKQASIDYMRGTAVNSLNKPNSACPGTIFFMITSARTGKVLSKLSQYPDEEELLFGPFNMFRVESVQPDPTNAFRNTKGEPMGLVIHLTSLGPIDCQTFYYKVRKDAIKASKRLQSDASKERLDVLRHLCTMVHSNSDPEELVKRCTTSRSFVATVDGIVRERGAQQEKDDENSTKAALHSELLRGLGYEAEQNNLFDFYELGVHLQEKITSLEEHLRNARDTISRQEETILEHEARTEQGLATECDTEPPPPPPNAENEFMLEPTEPSPFVPYAPFPYGSSAVDTPQLREMLFS